MSYTLTQQEYRNLKSRLTRAKKQGPEAIVAACDRALTIFENEGYPDDWHRWERAREDARMELARQNW